LGTAARKTILTALTIKLDKPMPNISAFVKLAEGPAIWYKVACKTAYEVPKRALIESTE